MNRIPCKKCPQCGLFNDFTIEKCECGNKLNSVGAQFIDADELSPEQYGEIDTSVKIYVQKCSACGAVNYTNNPGKPVRVCYNCHKTRIAAITPVEHIEEGNEESHVSSGQEDDEDVGQRSNNVKQTENQVLKGQQTFDTDDEDDEDDEDDSSVQWQGLLGNIQKAIENMPTSPDSKINDKNATNDGSSISSAQDDFEDDDDDEEISDWSGILGVNQKQNHVVKPKRRDITLTAIRYGRFSFTVQASEDIYMLGRSANQSDFLSQDGRVGNEHCFLFYRDGMWFVRDNNSRNGTAVNSRDIGLNGECMLSDRDELKLGHHSDSVAFRITIN